MTSYLLRAGKSVEADEAFYASTSGDSRRMLRALAVRTNAVDRHSLLMSIVRTTYKLREDPFARRTCVQVARMHIAEFADIVSVLSTEMGGTLPRVTTFAHLGTVLVEDGLFDEAIDVCRTAMRYGLHDGTTTGFPGRIARIRKKALPAVTRHA